MSDRSILFVVNPESQGGNTGKKWEKIYPMITSLLNHPSDFSIADGTGTGITITKDRIRDEGFTDVICVGGDGSINEVVNGIYYSNKLVNLGFIKSGTANDYLTNIAWPDNLDEQVSLINRGITIKTPIVKVNGDKERVCINVADTGIGALIAYSASIERRLKWIHANLRYNLLSLRGIFKWKNIPVRIIVDDREIGGDLSFFMSGFSKLSGGFKVLPQAERFGEKMAYTIAKDFNKFRMVKTMGTLKKGKHSEDIKGVYMGYSKNILIEGEHPLLFEVDGEPFSFNSSKIKLESLPEQISVLN